MGITMVPNCAAYQASRSDVLQFLSNLKQKIVLSVNYQTTHSISLFDAQKTVDSCKDDMVYLYSSRKISTLRR